MRIKILNENVCEIENCDCGANLQLGFEDKKDFYEFKKILKTLMNKSSEKSA